MGAKILSALPRLYYERKASRGITYVKSYDGYDWKPELGYAVKVNTKTIGRIDSGNGAGLIKFDPDFLKQNPKFKYNAVIRYYDEEDREFKLRVEDEVGTPQFVESYLTPSNHDVISVHSIGSELVYSKLLERDVLLSTLKKCFPSSYESILSLAYFCLDTNDFKSNRYALYAQEHKLPCQDELTPTGITRLFKSISETDELNFFSQYFEALYDKAGTSKRRFWALDSTSISTYARYLDAKFGHNKQDELIPQINLIMLTDQKSGRPLYYSRFNGSIPDVSTVTSTFENLLHIGTRSFVAVMDRGYYSKDNLDEIVSCGYHFLVCVPLERVDTFKDILLEAAQAFITGEQYESAIDENVFTKKATFDFKIKGKVRRKTLFVHVFYDQERAGAITKKILKRRADIIEMLKARVELDGSNLAFANQYLIQNEDGAISLNNAAFQSLNSRAGVFVLVSDCIEDGRQAYWGYRDRKTVEDCFEDLKVKMCADRFYTSSEESLPGKCFVQFVALSLYMRIEYLLKKRKEQDCTIPHHSVRSIIRDLQGIKSIEFRDGFEAIKPISKTQRESLALFSIEPPVSQYQNNIAIPNMVKYARRPHGDRKIEK